MTGTSACRYCSSNFARTSLFLIRRMIDCASLRRSRTSLIFAHQQPGIVGAAGASFRLPFAVALRAMLAERCGRQQVGGHFAVTGRAGRPAIVAGLEQLVMLAFLERDERPGVTGTAGSRQVDFAGGARRARGRQHVLVREKLLERVGITAMTPVAPDVGAAMRRRVVVLQVPEREPAPVGQRGRRVGDVAVRAAAALGECLGGGREQHEGRKYETAMEDTHTGQVFKPGAIRHQATAAQFPMDASTAAGFLAPSADARWRSRSRR